MAAQAPVPCPFSCFHHFLSLPTEIRLEIYTWVLFLGFVDPQPPSVRDPRIPPGGLGPLLTTNTFGTSLHQEVLHVRRVVGHESDEPREPHNARGPSLLPAFRPVGRPLPTSLLRVCRQVYYEARMLPFQKNEFVFLSLQSTALASAHAFIVLGCRDDNASNSPTAPSQFPISTSSSLSSVASSLSLLSVASSSPLSSVASSATIAPSCFAPRLQPWQRDNLWHVRFDLELSAADLGWPAWRGGGSAHSLDFVKWQALCNGLATGLRSMRLRLLMTATPADDDAEMTVTQESIDMETTAQMARMWEHGCSDRRHRVGMCRPVNDAVARSTFVLGLLQLAALRKLEMEIVYGAYGHEQSTSVRMTTADRVANVAWCADVEVVIQTKRAVENGGGSMSKRTPITVVCVERIPDDCSA